MFNIVIILLYRGVRDDIDQEDDQESFFRYMEENPLAGVVFDDDETVIEYDAEGNPIIPEKNKVSLQLHDVGEVSFVRLITEREIQHNPLRERFNITHRERDSSMWLIFNPHPHPHPMAMLSPAHLVYIVFSVPDYRPPSSGRSQWNRLRTIREKLLQRTWRHRQITT